MDAAASQYLRGNTFFLFMLSSNPCSVFFIVSLCWCAIDCLSSFRKINSSLNSWSFWSSLSKSMRSSLLKVSVKYFSIKSSLFIMIKLSLSAVSNNVISGFLRLVYCYNQVSLRSHPRYSPHSRTKLKFLCIGCLIFLIDLV